MKLLLLARDGVINSGTPFGDWQEKFEPLTDSLEAIATATREGVRCVAFAHLSDHRPHRVDVEQVNTLHLAMLGAVSELGGRLEAIIYCPHERDAGCDCHSPTEGILAQLLDRLKLPASEIGLVTTRADELSLAREIGALPILIAPSGRATSGVDTRNAVVVSDMGKIVDYAVKKPS
ncbi:MAG: hypothetical protein H6978_02125 [Gammaproteobacteria bacterium]|nr:hypothetical protein [Gammaproteobacteria bacterium]